MKIGAEEKILNKGFFEYLVIWKKLLMYSIATRRSAYLFLLIAGVISALLDNLFPLITKHVVDGLSGNHDLWPLWQYALVYLILALASILIISAMILQGSRLSLDLQKEFRQRCFDHCQHMSLNFYDSRQTGWLIAHVTSDSNIMGQTLSWAVFDLLWSVPSMMFIFGFLAYLYWPLAVILMCIVPLIFIVSVYFNQRIVQSSRKERQSNSKIIAVFNESIAGVQTTKSLVREERSQAEFEDDSQEYYSRSMRRVYFTALFGPCLILVVKFGMGLSLWLGGEFVIEEVMTLGTLIAFIAYTQSLLNPVNMLARVVVKVQTSTPAAERINELLKTEPEIKNHQVVDQQQSQALLSHIHTVDIRGLQFSYPNSSELILKDINLSVVAGERVALVGSTGSGKSTLVNVLCRFYEPNAGTISINGVSYQELDLHTFHSQLGIVLQSPLLFSGSIKSNIRYGCLHATDEQIISVAKQVKLHEQIMEMDQGYDSKVEQGGRNLSTGQKQLISFARAIIANPQIMIMDEATSAVDTRTEQDIQIAMEEVLKGRTSFIIAHRLSTIQMADKIVLLDQGRIIEIGSHASLLKAKGPYFDLYRNQFLTPKHKS